MFQFFKTTALGGILFLAPVIILIAVFTKAHQMISKVAAPVLAIVPVERVVGIVVVDLLALALLLLICFLAGLAAKTPRAGRLVASLASDFLSQVPGYELAKTKLTTQLFLKRTRQQPSWYASMINGRSALKSSALQAEKWLSTCRARLTLGRAPSPS